MRGGLKALVEETGKHWKEGGALSLHNWFPLLHSPPLASFSLLLASPMRSKGDDADVCDQLDVGDFDIGLEIFSKISVETR